MNKFITAAVIATMATTANAAETVKAKVKDVYVEAVREVPVEEEVCRNVDVTVYGNNGNGANAGDVLAGMIIGGIIGKAAGGNDKGAAAGAIIGGMVAADSKGKKPVGTRQEVQCEYKTTYRTTVEEVYSHSVVTFTHGGRKYQVEFTK